MSKAALAACALAVAMLAAAAATPCAAAAPARGYAARSCGMDLDRDGTIGEPEDCRACDGDARNDPAAISEWYVDAANGDDVPGCGATIAPCRTFAYAMHERADLSDGTADFFCGKGVMTAEPPDGIVVRGGPAGTYTMPKRSVDSRHDWTLPAKPTTILPWDTDGDGRYDDETLVFDGCPARRRFAFTAPASGGDNVEIAHVTIRKHGSAECLGPNADVTTGVYNFNDGAAFVYVHDAKIEDVNRRQPKTDKRAMWRVFTGANAIRHFYLHNVDVPNMASYGFRGGFGAKGPEDGPIEVNHATVTFDGCVPRSLGCSRSGASARWIEAFGMVSGVRVHRSILDARSGAWGASETGPNSAINANNCSRDWELTESEIVDFKIGFVAEPDAGGGGKGRCVDAGDIPRPVQRVLIDRNVFRQTPTTRHHDNSVGVYLEGPSANDPNEFTESVTITNNLFDCGRGGCLAAVAVEDASPGSPKRTDTLLIAHNTVRNCWPAPRSACISLDVFDSDSKPLKGTVAATARIENNLIQDVPGLRKAIEYAEAWATKVKIRNNVASPGATYGASGKGNLPFRYWDELPATSGEKQCVQAFAGDVELGGGGDACAIDAGVPLSDVRFDIHGTARPVGARPDVGAHEAAAAAKP